MPEDLPSTPEPTPEPAPEAASLGGSDPVGETADQADEIAAAALRAAQEAVAALNNDVPSSPAKPAAKPAPASDGALPFDLPDFTPRPSEEMPAGISLLSDVDLNVKIELGRTRMFVEDVLKLSEGSVVELDKLAGDPVDIYVNDKPIARGEVLVLNDNFCVRINEILAPVSDPAA